jgi:hypothetical protein
MFLLILTAVLTAWATLTIIAVERQRRMQIVDAQARREADRQRRLAARAKDPIVVR